MTVFVASILSFLNALPNLLRIFFWLKSIYGDNLSDFISDVSKMTKKVDKTIDPKMPITEKRRIRREALFKSRNLWARLK